MTATPDREPAALHPGHVLPHAVDLTDRGPALEEAAGHRLLVAEADTVGRRRHQR